MSRRWWVPSWRAKRAAPRTVNSSPSRRVPVRSQPSSGTAARVADSAAALAASGGGHLGGTLLLVGVGLDGGFVVPPAELGGVLGQHPGDAAVEDRQHVAHVAGVGQGRPHVGGRAGEQDRLVLPGQETGQRRLVAAGQAGDGRRQLGRAEGVRIEGALRAPFRLPAGTQLLGRVSSCREPTPVAEALGDQLLDHLGVGLALGGAHHLADEEAGQGGLARPVGLGLVGVGGDDLVDQGGDGALVADLGQAPLGDDLARGRRPAPSGRRRPPCRPGRRWRRTRRRGPARPRPPASAARRRSSRSPSSRGSSLMIQRATAAAGAPVATAPSKRSPVARSPVSRSASASERPWAAGQAANRSASTGSRRRASARYSVRLFFGGRVAGLCRPSAGPPPPAAARAAAASSARPAHESRRVTIRFSTRAPGRESTGSTMK